ncbi:MAG: hypothetical protein PHG03_02565 [Bacilli bacterium]|nr:hypothetical protein [Bacilli bacterium]
MHIELIPKATKFRIWATNTYPELAIAKVDEKYISCFDEVLDKY